MSRRRLAAVLVLLALLPAPARAQLERFETRDLRLVYPKIALRYIAPYTARCFENSMRFHQKLWNYHTDEKVNVILDDSGDYGNAGVWTIPLNSMVFHIAPTNFVYETGPSNERVNFTMNHEVVHVIALDQATGSDKFFRGMFRGKVRETPEHPETIVYGYLTVPRRAAPRWFHEGAAVFLETWMSGGLGRAQGPYDEMVFRSMVRDSAHFYDPLGLESEGTKIDFQVGVNSYLYGTRFLSWLGYTYGPEKIIAWVGRLPGSKAYFASQFRHVFGRPLDDAWQDWIAWEHQFQATNLDSIRRHPVTGSRDLSPYPLGSVSRAYVDSASHSILAAVNYPGTVAHVASIPLDGGTPKNLGDIKGPALYFVSSLAFDARARRLFYTADNNEWRDLCSYDLATGKREMLIRDARVGDLAFQPVDQSLWGVRNFNGYCSLVRLEAPYRDWTRIHTFPYGTIVYDLDLSPDGRRLSLSQGEISGRQSLRLYDIATLTGGDTTGRTLYDFGSSIPSGFVFSGDGRHLVGSSYYTGVSNLFRYDLDADSMDVVTNAETGFFRPIPGAGDSLIAFRYSGQGFVPCRLAAHPLTDVSAITFLGERMVAKHPVLKTWQMPPPSTIDLDTLQTAAPGPYPGLRSVGFRNLYPMVEGYKDGVAIGAQANFQDPIGMHHFDAAASWSVDGTLPDAERLHLSAEYRRYDFGVSYEHNRADFYDLFGPFKTSRKGEALGFEYNRTLIRDTPRTLKLDLSLDGYKDLEVLPDNQNVATSPQSDRLVTGQASLNYKFVRSSIGSIDSEKGWSWRVATWANMARFLERSGPLPPGVEELEPGWHTFPFALATLDFGRPLLIKNASWWIRTAVGASPGDRDQPYSNFFFGGFGNNYVDHQEPKRYRDYSQFPGAEIDGIAGRNFARVMVDYNLPGLRFRRAGTLAFYATWARLSLFSSALVTNVDVSGQERRAVFNAGAQADVRFQLLTQQPLTFSLGYARAFEEGHRLGDEFMVSLKVL